MPLITEFFIHLVCFFLSRGICILRDFHEANSGGWDIEIRPPIAERERERERGREGERERVGEQIDITQPQSKVEVAPVYIDTLQCAERSLLPKVQKSSIIHGHLLRSGDMVNNNNA